jgi:hypothetical protein
VSWNRRDTQALAVAVMAAFGFGGLGDDEEDLDDMMPGDDDEAGDQESGGAQVHITGVPCDVFAVLGCKAFLRARDSRTRARIWCRQRRESAAVVLCSVSWSP